MGIGEEAEELATFGRASDAVVLSRKRDIPLGVWMFWKRPFWKGAPDPDRTY